MGTYWSVKVSTQEKISSEVKERVNSAIVKRLKDFNQEFSTYIADSTISKFNSLTSLQEYKVSALFIDNLLFARKLWEQTNGRYDVTVGPLVEIWGFGPKKVSKAPSEKKLKEIIKYVGMDKLIIDSDKLTIRKIHGKLKIDLSSIAKGAGVDVISKLLADQFEFENTLVEIGGEVVTRGRKSKDHAWQVGVESPQEGSDKKIIKAVKLENLAIATSGNYRNIRVYKEGKFSHTIDPRSGKTFASDVLSASVITSSCMHSDAWATAMMSMPFKLAKTIALENNLAVMLLAVLENGEVTSFITPAWKSLQE